MVSLVADISRIIGSVSALSNFDKNPKLRRANRIRTIHDSLAIEQNTLTLEQVTSVLNGKMVIAPPKDIQEVKMLMRFMSCLIPLILIPLMIC